MTSEQHWDLKIPALSPRSRLYRLAPIGVGTAMVEGLSSYVMRLAEAHCVSTSKLITQQVAAQVQKIRLDQLPPGVSEQSVFASLALEQVVVKQVSAIDWVAPTKTVAKRVEILEQLTTQRQLYQLTLMPLQPWISFKNAFHATQPWCPDCYRTWQDANHPIYDPLLWSLNTVVVCPQHQRRLRFTCSVCDRTQPFLKLNRKLGDCHHCGTWLGQTSELLYDRDFKNSDLWKATAIARLLSVMPTLQDQPQPKKPVHFREFIQQCEMVGFINSWILEA